MLNEWRSRIIPIVEENRDANELDITAAEARVRGIVAGNETYIGRRVIAGNIARELPVFIQYLNGSFRHVTAVAKTGQLQPSIAGPIEEEFTLGFRTGNWLEDHVANVSSTCLHGRGVFQVIPTGADDLLGTRAVYVPPEDFVFPIESRDIQKAALVGVRYIISIDQLDDWAREYKWDPTIVLEIKSSDTAGDVVNKVYEVYLMFRKVADAKVAGDTTRYVEAFWFSQERSKQLTAPAPYTAGFFNKDGMPTLCPDYPFFPCWYNVTENPKLIERKGRAHMDMHDQEALTMIWTGAVNGYIRSSEIYIALQNEGITENPEIVQTEFIMDPGKILKKPVTFFNAPSPDPNMLVAANALKVENAAAAGQVDFAAQARKDSRKTAKELQLASQESKENQAVPLTMFALGYGQMLSFMFNVLEHNIASGYNQKFLAERPDIRQVIASGVVELKPAGDVDFVERNEKLKMFVQFYGMYSGTALGNYFLKKIIELAFPNEFQQMMPLLEDNSKQMGAALLQIVENLPQGMLPPDVQQRLQSIIAEAQRTFGQPQQGGQNAPTDQNPSAAESAGPGTAQP